MAIADREGMLSFQAKYPHIIHRTIDFTATSGAEVVQVFRLTAQLLSLQLLSFVRGEHFLPNPVNTFILPTKPDNPCLSDFALLLIE